MLNWHDPCSLSLSLNAVFHLCGDYIIKVSGAQVARLDYHTLTVRDLSWHPQFPILVSSSWDGDIVKWEFPGNGEAPVPLNKKKSRRI